MIGRIEDPERPDQEVFVPLRWNDERGRWEVLGKPPSSLPRFLRIIDAAHVCWVRFRARYDEMVQSARLLRVMCEHPDFVFEGDAISSDMVRERVQALSRALSMEQEEMDRLIDEPRVDDVVYLRDVRYVLDPNTSRLEPHGGDIEPRVPMPPPGPQARFDWLVRVCTMFAEELTGQEYSPLQVEAVVNRVQERLQDEGADRGTEH